MKRYLTPILALISYVVFTQTNVPSIDKALKTFDFLQEQILEENDTITYYLKKYVKKPKNLVVFIQGTGPNPIFSYKMEKGKPIYSRWFNDDYRNLDSTYTWAIIPKPGREGIIKIENINDVSSKFYKNDYLEYRVNQIDKSIKHIIKNHLNQPDKIIAYGHSEGAPIGAAIASINNSITHLGFWSGNVLNNFYEFSLFNRIESLQGKVSDEEAHKNIMGIIEWYKSVIKNPNSTEIDHYGFTNKRWSTYEKAPIDYLTQLEIPIYALFSTEDESTPIETAYLLPVKFIEKRKENLTFEVCFGCDHSYQIKDKNAKGSRFVEDGKKVFGLKNSTNL